MSHLDIESLRARVLADSETPEPVRQALQRGAALESIHLDARGRWWHEGEAFVNEKLALLFSRSLYQTERGLWLLRIGGQSYPVTVAGAGTFADRMRIQGQEVWLTLSTGEAVSAHGGDWLTDGEELLGVRLRDGRDVRLIGAAHQAALSEVSLHDDGWRIALPGGEVTLGGWPALPRGVRMSVEEAQG